VGKIQYYWRCLKYGAENQMGINHVGILTALRVPSPSILALSVETHGVRLFLFPLDYFNIIWVIPIC